MSLINGECSVPQMHMRWCCMCLLFLDALALRAVTHARPYLTAHLHHDHDHACHMHVHGAVSATSTWTILLVVRALSAYMQSTF
jgi:hypothetical protein